MTEIQRKSEWKHLIAIIGDKGCVLSDFSNYENSKSKLEFKCKCGHKWITTFRAVAKNNQWCKPCGYKIASVKKLNPHGLEMAKKFAEENGGKCLSVSYSGHRDKLLFQCRISKHPPFLRSYNTIRKGRGWCQVCDKERPKGNQHTIGGIKDYVLTHKNGTCLSEIYVNSKTVLLFKCNILEHSPFWQRFDDVKNHNTWCPSCANEEQSVRARNPNGLKIANEVAKKNGGECLSELYIRGDNKLKWRCGNPAHDIFFRSFNSVVFHNRWCPKCKVKQYGKGEELVRTVFEIYYGSSFVRTRPNWNKANTPNHPNILDIERTFLKINRGVSNRPLEIDGYTEISSGNIITKIGFEYQGRQHYDLKHIRHCNPIDKIRKYSVTNFNDLTKKQNCIDSGVMLYEIPEIHPSLMKNCRLFLNKLLNILENQGLQIVFTEEQILKIEKRFNSI